MLGRKCNRPIGSKRRGRPEREDWSEKENAIVILSPLCCACGLTPLPFLCSSTGMDLLQLTANIKRDPNAYREEFLQQLRHFSAELQVFLLKPSKEFKQFATLIKFISQVRSRPFPPPMSTQTWSELAILPFATKKWPPASPLYHPPLRIRSHSSYLYVLVAENANSA